MPQQHSAETRAKMSASAARAWRDPEIREKRVSALKAARIAQRSVSEVVIRQASSADRILAVSSWTEDGRPVVDLDNT